MQPLCTLPVDPRYRLEVEDPLHRHAEVLAAPFAQWKQVNNTALSFWDFLEEQKEHFPNALNPRFQIQWLTDTERTAYQIHFSQDEAGIHLSTSRTGTIEEGKWMFVLMNDHFYAAREEKYKVHHTTLSSGNDVAAAGEFSIKNSTLAKISFVSGHYRTRISHGQNCLRYMQTLNLKLDSNTIKYHLVDHTEHCLVDDFLKIDPLTQPPSSSQSIHSESLYPIAFKGMPLTIPPEWHGEKKGFASMTLIKDAGIFVCPKKLASTDPKLTCLGQPLIKGKAKFTISGISKCIFSRPLDLPETKEHIQHFLQELSQRGLNLDTLYLRINDVTESKKLKASEFFTTYFSQGAFSGK